MKLAMQITVEDIENGERCRHSRCPVARAFRRTLGLTVDEVSVTPRSIIATYRGREYRGHFPKAVTNAVNRYDVHGVFAPMSFDVELVEAAPKLGSV